MKALKKILISLGLTCCLLAGVLIANAADPAEINNPEHIYDLESFYNLDYMVENIENLFSEPNRIEVIDSNDHLVAEGTKNDEKIQGYIGISDLLTEIDGIQYYRLSYK